MFSSLTSSTFYFWFAATIVLFSCFISETKSVPFNDEDESDTRHRPPTARNLFGKKLENGKLDLNSLPERSEDHKIKELIDYLTELQDIAENMEESSEDRDKYFGQRISDPHRLPSVKGLDKRGRMIRTRREPDLSILTHITLLREKLLKEINRRNLIESEARIAQAVADLRGSG